MRIKEVLNAEGKSVYEEIDGRMILTRIIFHNGETREMGKKTVTEGPLSVTYWYEYGQDAPVRETDSFSPNYEDTDPDGQG